MHVRMCKAEAGKAARCPTGDSHSNHKALLKFSSRFVTPDTPEPTSLLSSAQIAGSGIAPEMDAPTCRKSHSGRRAHGPVVLAPTAVT